MHKIESKKILKNLEDFQRKLFEENKSMDNSNSSTTVTPTSTTSQTEAIGREIFRVGVKPPQFFKDEPDLYFIQMEAQFRNARITAENTKYDHTVASLDPQYLQLVSDIIRNPPTENPYTELKQRIIKEFTDSDQRKLRRLIKEIELGDDKPSQLLQKMKKLAGNSISDDAIKSLWIERLPESVRAVISIVDGDSTQWAKQADKMMEISSFSNIASVGSTLQEEIAALRQQIHELKNQNQHQNRNRSTSRNNRNRYRNRSRSRNNEEYDFCWYHYRFKDNAKKCVQPCKFNGQKKESEN